MRRYFAGLGSLLALVAIIVGIPTVLIVAAGNPLPTTEQFNSIITLTPDYGNVILVTKILPMIGWVAWAFFALPMLIELLASITGRTTGKRARVFRFQQRLALTLLAAVAVMFTGAVMLAAPAQSASAGTTQSDRTSEPSGPSEFARHFTLPTPTGDMPTPTGPSRTSAAVLQPTTTTVTHKVAPGDTLWDLAEHYYGDGTRDLDIYHASTATVQPGGAHLSDPDLILPGWLLTVPGAAIPVPAPAPPETAAPDRSSKDSGPAQIPNEASPRTALRSDAPDASSSANRTTLTPKQTTTPVEARQGALARHSINDDLDLTIPIATGGGIAGLLAAGLLIAISRRRLRQRRNRPVGARIAMPGPVPSDLELQLRMIQDPLRLAHLDNALRTLQISAEKTPSAFPDLFAVRLEADEIALYFGAPTWLPASFTLSHEDHTIWTIRADDVPVVTGETISPYPALTTIGVDRNGGLLVLNLEHLGLLNIVGDDALCSGFMNAIAAELASSPWSEQIQVTLVGMSDHPGRSLSPSRLHQDNDVERVLRNLRHDLDDRRDAFASLSIHGTRQARATATATESWAPHVVLVGGPVDPDAERRMAKLVSDNPGLGLVVVICGGTGSDWAMVRMTSEDQAELSLPGVAVAALPFTPQMVQARELDLVQRLVDTTTQAPQSQYSAAEASTIHTGDSIVVTTVDGPEFHSTENSHFSGDGVKQSVLKDTAVPGWAAPYLRVLGPVDLLHVADEAAMPGRGVELVAFVSLNGAIEGRQLQHAFWPDTVEAGNNQRQLAKRVRVALGHTPNGQLIFPENTDHHGYNLHPMVRSDWDDFRTLTGSALTGAETKDLIAALRLVRGQPFANCNTRRWWHWIAIAEEDMIATVLDTADEVAARSLAAHDYASARFAAHVAQTVDPLNEAGWRIELRLALQTGDRSGFEASLNDLYARLGGEDPDYDLDDATRQLVEAFATEKATTR